MSNGELCAVREFEFQLQANATKHMVNSPWIKGWKNLTRKRLGQQSRCCYRTNFRLPYLSLALPEVEIVENSYTHRDKRKLVQPDALRKSGR